jgi:hypothetical protein
MLNRLANKKQVHSSGLKIAMNSIGGSAVLIILVESAAASLE